MSEAERRTGYNSERILIDASRILSPQFGAQGIFLSGAQVELLRNAVAYLGRDTTFVDEYHDCYYLRVTDGDFDTIQAIVADLEDKLLMVENTMFGYSETLHKADTLVSDGSIPEILSAGVVPAGELWMVESFTVRHNSAAERQCLLVDVTGAVEHHIMTALTVPPNLWYGGLTSVTLAAGDELKTHFYGMVNGDVLYFRLLGYIMKVPE